MSRILFLLLLLASSPGLAADWHWVRVAPDAVSGWQIEQGTAEVTLDGGRLKAVLRTGGSPKVDAYTLEGAVRGRDVTATEIEIGTDASPFRLTGTLTRTRTPAGAPSRGWGSDRITLNGSDRHLGLFRRVAPGEK